jgi:hypothetical protein
MRAEGRGKEAGNEMVWYGIVRVRADRARDTPVLGRGEHPDCATRYHHPAVAGKSEDVFREHGLECVQVV